MLDLIQYERVCGQCTSWLTMLGHKAAMTATYTAYMPSSDDSSSIMAIKTRPTLTWWAAITRKLASFCRSAVL